MSGRLVGEVIEWLQTPAGRDLTPNERIALLTIAERAGEKDRKMWRHKADQQTLTERIAGAIGIEPKAVGGVMGRLAARGLESRIPIGFEKKSGRPVYACKGRAVSYRLPELPASIALPESDSDTCTDDERSRRDGTNEPVDNSERSRDDGSNGGSKMPPPRDHYDQRSRRDGTNEPQWSRRDGTLLPLKEDPSKEDPSNSGDPSRVADVEDPPSPQQVSAASEHPRDGPPVDLAAVRLTMAAASARHHTRAHPQEPA